MIATLLLVHLLTASDAADSTGLDSLTPQPSRDSSVVLVPRQRGSVGLTIQSPYRPPSPRVVTEPEPPGIPTPVFDIGLGLRLAERGWVGFRSGLGSNYDRGLFVSFHFEIRKDLGKLSHDSTIRYRTESKGFRLGLEGDKGYLLLPWFSAYLHAGLAYRWEVLHMSADTTNRTYLSVDHDIGKQSEWESGFLLPLGIGLRVKPGRRLRILAGMEFEPSWTKARFHYTDDRRNLSGSRFHLSTSPSWTFGLDWIFTSGS